MQLPGWKKSFHKQPLRRSFWRLGSSRSAIGTCRIPQLRCNNISVSDHSQYNCKWNFPRVHCPMRKLCRAASTCKKPSQQSLLLVIRTYPLASIPIHASCSEPPPLSSSCRSVRTWPRNGGVGAPVVHYTQPTVDVLLGPILNSAMAKRNLFLDVVFVSAGTDEWDDCARS